MKSVCFWSRPLSMQVSIQENLRISWHPFYPRRSWSRSSHHLLDPAGKWAPVSEGDVCILLRCLSIHVYTASCRLHKPWSGLGLRHIQPFGIWCVHCWRWSAVLTLVTGPRPSSETGPGKKIVVDWPNERFDMECQNNNQLSFRENLLLHSSIATTDHWPPPLFIFQIVELRSKVYKFASGNFTRLWIERGSFSVVGSWFGFTAISIHLVDLEKRSRSDRKAIWVNRKDKRFWHFISFSGSEKTKLWPNFKGFTDTLMTLRCC